MQSKPLERQRSAEKIKAKRDGLLKKRFQGGESGDDEDEELGRKSPMGKGPRTSKLGVEMMRTNSRGSVISASDGPREGKTSPASSIAEEGPEKQYPATITPPEIFPRAVGDAVAEVDMDVTPRVGAGERGDGEDSQEPTPRGPTR